MNQSASGKGTKETLKQESGSAALDETPRHSHVRELTPRSRTEIEIDEESTDDSRDSGFFSQNTLIKMGDTFPALKTVARLLTLESYRSLPKPDKLPDLSDLPDVADDDTPIPGGETQATLPNAHALLDWDEMEIEENPRTPYQLYLFDLRVEGYLAQTRAQLGPSLLKKRSS